VAFRRPDKQEGSTALWQISPDVQLIRAGPIWSLHIKAKTYRDTPLGGRRIELTKAQAGDLLRQEREAYLGHPFRRAVDDADGVPAGTHNMEIVEGRIMVGQRSGNQMLKLKLVMADGMLSQYCVWAGYNLEQMPESAQPLFDQVLGPAPHNGLAATGPHPYRAATAPPVAAWTHEQMAECYKQLLGRKVRAEVKLRPDPMAGTTWRLVDILGPA